EMTLLCRPHLEPPWGLKKNVPHAAYIAPRAGAGVRLLPEYRRHAVPAPGLRIPQRCRISTVVAEFADRGAGTWASFPGGDIYIHKAYQLLRKSEGSRLITSSMVLVDGFLSPLISYPKRWTSSGRLFR